IGRTLSKSPDYVELRIAAAEHPVVLAAYLAGAIDQRQIRAAIRALARGEALPEGSGMRDQGSGIRGQESGVRGQESGVRGQESGVRGQGSGTTYSSLTPDSCLLTPGDGQVIELVISAAEREVKLGVEKVAAELLPELAKLL